MSLSNAERQSRYKKTRHKANNGDGEYQLNCWITSQAKFALKRLAKHHGITQRAVLEWLLIESDETTWRSLSEDQQDEYLEVCHRFLDS